MSVPAVARSRRCVLVVEDEYLIAMDLKRWLQEAGYEVLGPVPSAEQALDLIEHRQPDAAVLDINLGYGDDSCPVADMLGLLSVPYLFATGDVKPADTSVYRHRPRLEKPVLEAQLVRGLADLFVATQHLP